jgi:hypothetical protein
MPVLPGLEVSRGSDAGEKEPLITSAKYHVSVECTGRILIHDPLVSL